MDTSIHDAQRLIFMTNGNTTKKATKQDWRPFNGMIAEQRHDAALADPDAQPLTPERLKHVKPAPRVFVIRRALRLSQEEFAAKFHIPLGTLRDWEQSRKEPDAAARAYLKVIARNPAAVAKALQPAKA